MVLVLGLFEGLNFKSGHSKVGITFESNNEIQYLRIFHLLQQQHHMYYVI